MSRLRSTSTFRLRAASLLVAAVAVLAVSACSDPEPELTIGERLELVAGRTLSPAEVVSQLETADDLCQLDDQLLLRLWAKLDEQQFAFQQFVFNHHCPDRSALIEGFVHSPTTVSTSTTSARSRPSSLPTTTDPRNSGVIVNSNPDASTTTTSAASVSTTTPRFGGPDTAGPDSTRIGEGG